MVEDRVTDGKRVGQLLASELSGRSDGRLDRVSVVDADPQARPDDDGTLAYRVAFDDDRVADVSLYPDRVELLVRTGPEAVADRAREEGLEAIEADDGARVRVDDGAAVKRALDALLAGLS